MLALKPERGKPAFRNFREGDGNGGIIRSPLRAIALPDSREMYALPRKRQVLRGADVVGVDGRQHLGHRQRKVDQDPARSKTPGMYASTLYGNREIPRLSAIGRVADRNGKSKDARR